MTKYLDAIMYYQGPISQSIYGLMIKLWEI